MQLRSHNAESSYPPLPSLDSPDRPSQPYFHLDPVLDQADSSVHDRDASFDQIRYDTNGRRAPSDSESEGAERDQRHGFRSLGSESDAEASNAEQRGPSSTASEDADLVGSPPPFGLASGQESLPGETANRGTGRGRGKGRGRGRRGGLRALLNRGSDNRDGTEIARGSPRGRPRGSRRPLRGEGQRGGGKGSKRGPKAPAEPSEEFKSLLARANSAYIAGNYDEALDQAGQAIQINPEIFAAHNLVSEIYRILGKEEKSLEFLFSAAHTRREPGVWWQVASRTESSTSMSEEARQERLLYCYSRITQIEKDNFDARRCRLNIYMQHDRFGNAIRECRAMLRIRPNDLETLQLLAEMCVEASEVPTAKAAYEDSIKSLEISNPLGPGDDFTFSDLNIYLELFAHLRLYVEGLKTLKSVARWLCGRSDETFWDENQSDDCEWDINHQPRRVNVPGFQPAVHPSGSYGQALPLEIRAKAGIFRLRLGPTHFGEAMRHFMLMDPANNSEQAPVFDYPDLFRDIGDVLYSSGFFAPALQFYEPLLKTQRVLESDIRHRMAESYRHTSRQNMAIVVYESLIKDEPNDPIYIVDLARVYESLGDNAKALEYVEQVLKMGRRDILKRADLKCVPSPKRRAPWISRADPPAADRVESDDSGEGTEFLASSHTSEDESESDLEQTPKVPKRRPSGRVKQPDAKLRPLQRSLPDPRLSDLYMQMEVLRPAMRDEDEGAVIEWMERAETLLEDFKAMPVFFPPDRYMQFLGYTAASRQRSYRLRPGDPPTAVEVMAHRLETSIDDEDESNAVLGVDESKEVPKKYRGITFADWLDMFCEYAFCAARLGQGPKAYDAIGTAKDANVFFHNEQAHSHIHVVWFTCALLLNDEENACRAARFFIKAYPGATDTYRLYAALNRLLPGEPNWYHAGPSQKFTLRQIKMMDFALLDSDQQRKRFNLTSTDRSGGAFAFGTLAPSYTLAPSPSRSRASAGGSASEQNPLGIVSLDPALLNLYGNMLATSGSYRNALNYYFRSYASDPQNAMTVFCMSIAYLQLSIKRQASNRHYFVVQALAFFNEYKRLRLQGIVVDTEIDTGMTDADAEGADQQRVRERKRVQAEMNRKSEVEYNQGRLWHYLGLTHLAITAYDRCLAVGAHDGTSTDDEDVFMRDDGNEDLADGEMGEPDFKREAAFALQQIYAVGGDMAKAREITEKWLVV